MPIGVTLSLPALALSGYLFATFETGVAGFQFVERAVWYEPWRSIGTSASTESRFRW